MDTDALSTLLILGAGGHGRVVADAAQRTGAWSVIIATDRVGARCVGELLDGVPLHPIEVLSQASMIHVAVGDNAARRRECVAVGVERLMTIIHPQASVSRHSFISAGSLVAAFAVVAPSARLGYGLIVNHGAVVDHDVRVGDYSHIAPGARLGGGTSVGADVLVGAGASVLPGLKICDGVIVGAGAVVTHDISEAGTWVGVPARRIQ